MFIDDDDDLMNKFYTDAINSAVFDTPVSYLSKYTFDNYEIVINTQAKIIECVRVILGKQIQKPSKISELLTEHNIDERVNKILSKILSNKLQDIKREILRKQITRGGKCLLDNNWRLVNILSNNWSAFTNKILLELTLIIENKATEQSEERVTFQLGIHELEQFINRLKQIKIALKS